MNYYENISALESNSYKSLGQLTEDQDIATSELSSTISAICYNMSSMLDKRDEKSIVSGEVDIYEHDFKVLSGNYIQTNSEIDNYSKNNAFIQADTYNLKNYGKSSVGSRGFHILSVIVPNKLKLSGAIDIPVSAYNSLWSISLADTLNSQFSTISAIDGQIVTFKSDFDSHIQELGVSSEAQLIANSDNAFYCPKDSSIGNAVLNFYNQHAEGGSVHAIAQYSHAEGRATTAEGRYSHAEGGDGTTAGGVASHAEGFGTKALGNRSHAEGSETSALEYASHAEGWSTIALERGSHAEGYMSKATANCAHAEGGNWKEHKNGGKASGIASHAEGLQTTASGTASHAEGQETLALSVATHSEGYKTTALCAYSHAEGQQTSAVGIYSHVEGYLTKTSGDGSHAEGREAIANGKYAHAEGQQTSALGQNSHTEGRCTIANAENAHAGGLSCEVAAAAYNSIALGRCSRVQKYHKNAFVWQGHSVSSSNTYYESRGEGTFCINPQDSALSNVYIGSQNLNDIISNRTAAGDSAKQAIVNALSIAGLSPNMQISAVNLGNVISAIHALTSLLI